MTFKRINLRPTLCKLTKRKCIFLSISVLLPLTFYLASNTIVWCNLFVIESKLFYLCEQYSNRIVSGDFCEPLCKTVEVSDISCLPHNANDVWFKGKMRNRLIVIKKSNPSPPLEDLTWTDTNGRYQYPADDVFQRMVRRSIYIRFNKTLSHQQLTGFIRYFNGTHRGDQISDIWDLVHDNDFILGKLYEDLEIFPHIFGTCGNYYVTEFLQPLIQNSGIGVIGAKDWKTRIRSAILILDLLKDLDQSNELHADPIRMCDPVTSDFGISNNRVKYANLAHVFPKFFIDRKLSDGHHCHSNDQCNYKDCHGECDSDSGRCLSKQINDNLKITCEKILKGTFYYPGLLMSGRTPASLSTLLDKCISTKTGVLSRDLRTAMYNDLVDIYETLTRNSDVPIASGD